jgi:hypothetical protein
MYPPAPEMRRRGCNFFRREDGLQNRGAVVRIFFIIEGYAKHIGAKVAVCRLVFDRPVPIRPVFNG